MRRVQCLSFVLLLYALTHKLFESPKGKKGRWKGYNKNSGAVSWELVRACLQLPAAVFTPQTYFSLVIKYSCTPPTTPSTLGQFSI